MNWPTQAERGGWRRSSAVLLLLPLLSVVGHALMMLGQAGPFSSGLTISVDVNLVMLHVTVRGKDSGFVSGLNQQDFQVSEDGVLQSIRFFRHEDLPVAVGLIMDNSGSMGPKKKDVTAAALTFVRSSNPQDEMFVLNFNEHVYFGLPETTPFSDNVRELETALNSLRASGGTALYDALEAGVTHLNSTTLQRKVLIVISDGGDNASHIRIEKAMDALNHSDIAIYTIGLFDEDDHDRNPGTLRRIARATGGESFFPDQSAAVVPICQRIADDIRNEYTIGYVSTNQKLDDTYRKVRVTATGQRHKQYTVRTRAGYFASVAPRDAPQFRTGKKQ